MITRIVRTNHHPTNPSTQLLQEGEENGPRAKVFRVCQGRFRSLRMTRQEAESLYAQMEGFNYDDITK